MNTQRTDPAVQKPWYRQFWPWFIMALPATAVVAGLSTVVIAVVNQDSVVRDDWYKEGKAINQNLARDTVATRLGMAADVRVDEVTGEVSVRLRQAGNTGQPDQLTLYFQHPTQARADQHLLLSRRAGEYRGQLPHALQGRFYIELGTPGWRLLGNREFPQAEFALMHD